LVFAYVGLHNPIQICLLYSPPNASANYKQDLIAHLSSDSSQLIIMGDFSIPDVNWATGSTNFSSQLCDLVFQYNLMQIVDCPLMLMKHGSSLKILFSLG